MSVPRAFHLPGFDPDSVRQRALAQTGLEVPELRREDVVAVWQALDVAAAEWRRRPLSARRTILARVAAQVRATGPGRWGAWLARSTGLSEPGLAAAWEATFAPWDDAAIEQLLIAERAAEVADSRWPRRLVHIASGNVLPPTFSVLARGLLVGAAQWLRPSRREPLFAACLADHLRQMEPEIADTFAVGWWEHAEPAESAVLGAADAVSVQGDDASVAAVRVRTMQLAPHARFVGYGSRWSAVLLSHAALTETNARAVARDIALFDQQGCLSPSLVLIEDGPRGVTWCASLAAALQEIEAAMPRGTLAPSARAGLRLWHETARLGVALGTVRGFWEGAGADWGVALYAGAAFDDSPLDRHVPVVPFTAQASVAALLGERRRRLQGVAVDLAGWDRPRRDALLDFLQPTHIAAPGTLQLAPPAWRQDHRDPLRSLLLDEG